MCTCEDTLAHNLGAPYIDDIMSYNSLTTLISLSLLCNQHTEIIKILDKSSYGTVNCVWSPKGPVKGLVTWSCHFKARHWSSFQMVAWNLVHKCTNKHKPDHRVFEWSHNLNTRHQQSPVFNESGILVSSIQVVSVILSYCCFWLMKL